MKNYLLLFAALVILSSCASTSNFIEAESLGQSNQSFMYGGELAFVSDNNYVPAPIPLPVASFSYGRGLTDNLDFRGVVRSNLTSEIGVKYQFYDTDATDLAASFNLNVGFNVPGPELVFHSQFNVGNVSILVNPSFAFMRNAYTVQGPTIENPEGIFWGPEVGLSTGLMFGESDQFKLALNAKLFPTGEASPIIYGLGFAYDLKPGFESGDSKASKGKKKKKKKKRRRRRRR
ncbi:hypothetical protein N9B82_01895 [Saprospiraceae bacterium]|nr:hypothetical protein [Saprospiraceae bacterium]